MVQEGLDLLEMFQLMEGGAEETAWLDVALFVDGAGVDGTEPKELVAAGQGTVEFD